MNWSSRKIWMVNIWSVLWTVMLWLDKLPAEAYVGLVMPTLIAWLGAHVMDKRKEQ